MSAKSATRTCLVCKSREEAEDLLRLAAGPEGQVVPDLKGNLPGRGAWVHWTRACLEKVDRHPGMLQRPLGTSPAPGFLLPTLHTLCDRALADGLSMAAAAGALRSGHDELESAMRSGDVDLVITASDAAKRTLGDLTRANEAIQTQTLGWTKDRLGESVGKGSRAAVGILRSRATTHLRRVLRRLDALG